uniref:Uncharacterized protein n=1 Tax=Trichogramma kaykai TaxID=54128 RepID=A0ABD2XCN4_9HYME
MIHIDRRNGDVNFAAQPKLHSKSQFWNSGGWFFQLFVKQLQSLYSEYSHIRVAAAVAVAVLCCVYECRGIYTTLDASMKAAHAVGATLPMMICTHIRACLPAQCARMGHYYTMTLFEQFSRERILCKINSNTPRRCCEQQLTTRRRIERVMLSRKRIMYMHQGTARAVLAAAAATAAAGVRYITGHHPFGLLFSYLTPVMMMIMMIMIMTMMALWQTRIAVGSRQLAWVSLSRMYRNAIVCRGSRALGSLPYKAAGGLRLYVASTRNMDDVPLQLAHSNPRSIDRRAVAAAAYNGRRRYCTAVIIAPARSERSSRVRETRTVISLNTQRDWSVYAHNGYDHRSSKATISARITMLYCQYEVAREGVEEDESYLSRIIIKLRAAARGQIAPDNNDDLRTNRVFKRLKVLVCCCCCKGMRVSKRPFRPRSNYSSDPFASTVCNIIIEASSTSDSVHAADTSGRHVYSARQSLYTGRSR